MTTALSRLLEMLRLMVIVVLSVASGIVVALTTRNVEGAWLQIIVPFMIVVIPMIVAWLLFRITPVSVMNATATALLLSILCTCPARAQRSDFAFTLSGALAGKLEHGTRALIWSPVTETKPKWVEFSIEDLPVTVPFQRLNAGHVWIVTFRSPTDDAAVLSLELSPELFDRPRRIDLTLDRPRPHIRPSGLGKLQFYYHAGITQRMSYRELPFWDKERQRIIAAKPPVMRIVRVSDGAELQRSDMQEGCMGSRWWTSIDPLIDLGEHAALQLIARYDSGGLWDPIVTTLGFSYHESLHGVFR
jgi:hypothetical protein